MPGRHINDHQMRLYMKSRLTEKKPASAAQAAMSLRTAYRIENDARLPSQKALPRGRRRPDPLVSIFDPEIVPMLQATPGLRAIAIFEEMQRRHPELPDCVRRTLERRIRHWRALNGQDREVIFRQVQEPGRMGLSDFTEMGDLDRGLRPPPTGTADPPLARPERSRSGGDLPSGAGAGADGIIRFYGDGRSGGASLGRRTRSPSVPLPVGVLRVRARACHPGR